MSPAFCLDQYYVKLEYIWELFASTNLHLLYRTTRGPRQLRLPSLKYSQQDKINISDIHQTNISKCKKHIQTWCNFQGIRTVGAEINLNWATKGTSSFTPPRKNYEAKMCLGLPREVNQDPCLCKHWTEPKGVELGIFR